LTNHARSFLSPIRVRLLGRPWSTCPNSAMERSQAMRKDERNAGDWCFSTAC
jgi:hypothetical protein